MIVKSVICDIEGTTTSISFVKDVLFKYAYDNCEKYLTEHYEEPEIQDIIKNLNIDAQNDGLQIAQSNDKTKCVCEIASYVQKLIDKDKKLNALKVLQGKIWKFAFESNIVSGHVFEDVLRNFIKWTDNGLQIYIYSSGSVEAQRLLFKYSTSGDLTPYITDYFDTNIGHKQDPKSYENILKNIQHNGRNVLFLSDIPNELHAAKQAGMEVLLLRRPNNYEISEKDNEILTSVNNFDEIVL